MAPPAPAAGTRQPASLLEVLRGLTGAAAPSCADDSLLCPTQPERQQQHLNHHQQQQHQQQHQHSSVPVECAASLSYARFVAEYMAPNRPVLIKGACDGWRAVREWRRSADGCLDLARLQELAGHCVVSVTDTARHHNGSGPCRSMAFSEYAAWWQQHHSSQQQQQQQGDSSGQQAAERLPLWYLKDWHLVSELPEYQPYATPEFFRDDWLNEFYDQQQQQSSASEAQEAAAGGGSAGGSSSSSSSAVTSDYRFVYLGPAGSWTPVHSDVLRSFSWSANVVGRKRWWLLPPQHTHLLLDRHGQLPADFFAPAAGTGSGGDGSQQPRVLNPAVSQHLLELVQEAGDVLFVPSGWHHMVVNEVATLSINHNWLNAHNVHRSWALLALEHRQATAQLEDCRDTASPEEFEGLVQAMLAANSGFSFQEFARFLGTIIQRRLAALPALLLLASQQQQQQQQPEEQQEQQAHAALDLSRAARVLQQVAEAAVEAAARNAAWHDARRAPRPAPAATSTSSPAPTPGWVAEAAQLAHRGHEAAAAAALAAGCCDGGNSL